MAARGVADDRDARGIEAELGRAASEAREGHEHVVGRPGPAAAGIAHAAVLRGHHDVARLAQGRGEGTGMLDAIGVQPATAVHEHDQRARRPVLVEPELAPLHLDVAVGLDAIRRRRLERQHRTEGHAPGHELVGALHRRRGHEDQEGGEEGTE